MATYTSYLNLEKPAVGETFNLLKINQNWDKIDQGVSALNSKIANIDKTFIINETSLTALENAILGVAQTLGIGHVAIGTIYGNYADSLTAGATSSAIIHRHSSSTYKIAILNECISGYYYSNVWHWSKATMTSFTPT